MKKIITLILLIFLCKVGAAQVWNQVNNSYPGAGGRGSAAFSIGENCYFVGGAPFVYQNWSYDTLSGNWTSLQAYPGTADGAYVGFAVNGMGYVGTGVGFGDQWDSTMWQYNPGTNQWTKLAHFPGQPRGYDVGFTIDGRCFIGCGIGNSKGSNGLALNDFYEYDPSTNTWKQIASYPGLGVQLDVSFTIGDKAYVGCGATINSGGSGTVVDSDFYEYDTTSKVWTRIADFPSYPRYGATGLGTCDRGYVGLGTTLTNTMYNDFWEYNPNKGPKGTWTQIANYGGNARYFANGFVIGKSFFVGLGVDQANNTQNDIWEYIPSVTPAFSADTFVCQGGTIMFTDTSSFTPDHWYWQFPGGTPDTSSQQSVTITYDTSGYHDVILTAWNTCDSASEIFVNYVHVGGGGGILSIVPPHATICNGQSVSLVIKDTIGTFTWNPSTGLNSTIGDSVIATPSVTTTYTVTGTGSGGCSSTGTDTVKVDSAPALIILPQPPPTFCSGQSATLKVSSGGSDFTWSPSSGLSATTGDSVVANPTASITYTVMGNDYLGCVALGTEPVNIILSPNKPTFYQHGDTLISSSKYDNQWYLNGNMLNNDTSQDLIITTTGNYWVNVINEANGCSTTSDTTTIDTVNGINQLAAIANQLSIYPNPFSNDIFIKINSSAENVKDWRLQITDVLRRTVYNKPSLNYNNDINLSNLPGGVYFITVINKTGSNVTPVVRQ